MDFNILNWNIAGAKWLEDSKDDRDKWAKKFNNELRRLIEDNNSDVITLEEIVQYGNAEGNFENLVNEHENYDYVPFPLFNNRSWSIKAKWNKIMKNAKDWPKDTYFAQGNAILFKKDAPHFPIWSLPASSSYRFNQKGPYIEKVNLESGLYFGDRDTEPRAALVVHFVFDAKHDRNLKKPLDIFVVNVHLTTLTMEREGIPEIDVEASRIRLAQLSIIFNGIISRYNRWREQKYPERNEKRKAEDWENFDRYPPVWILTGDFNFTPESVEYETIKRLNFIDVINNPPHKVTGTKASGRGKPATLTLDYVFAGPKFISLSPLLTEDPNVKSSSVINIKLSDHYPMAATIHIDMRDFEE